MYPNARYRSLIGFFVGALAVSALVLAFGLWIFQGGFTAQAVVTPLESRLASVALQHSIPVEYHKMTNQMADTPEYMHEGMEHFADHCASCHANNGSGDTMFGRGLNPRPPDLRLAATQHKSDGDLYYIIEHGVRMTGMPAFGQPGGGHSHGSWNLVTFIRHLPQLTPQEELQMQGMNPVTPSEMKEQQAEEEFLNGTNNKGGSK